jgi:DnaJ-class molecular chaperone
MTPYAILMVRPSDSDASIRAAYHTQARRYHPDAVPGGAQPQWYTYTGAYQAIKTEAARAAWEARQALLSGRCLTCRGRGVAGSRAAGGKIRLCAVCGGEGRMKK